MKFRKILVLMSVMFMAAGCGSDGVNSNPENPPEQTPPSTPPEDDPPGQSGPVKVTVDAHTLSDSNPPITIDGYGDRVSKETWDSFKNGTANKFINHYNYTYHCYSGGYETTEMFTKNGYYMRTFAGKQYYERKSGSTFYQYVELNYELTRMETTGFNLQDKYTSRIVNELYVHMFDFDNYEFDEEDGTYRYIDYGFGSHLRFQNGYLVYLFYATGSNIFEIKEAFNTKIDIPKSYYTVNK